MRMAHAPATRGVWENVEETRSIKRIGIVFFFAAQIFHHAAAAVVGALFQ